MPVSAVDHCPPAPLSVVGVDELSAAKSALIMATRRYPARRHADRRLSLAWRNRLSTDRAPEGSITDMSNTNPAPVPPIPISPHTARSSGPHRSLPSRPRPRQPTAVGPTPDDTGVPAALKGRVDDVARGFFSRCSTCRSARSLRGASRACSSSMSGSRSDSSSVRDPDSLTASRLLPFNVGAEVSLLVATVIIVPLASFLAIIVLRFVIEAVVALIAIAENTERTAQHTRRWPRSRCAGLARRSDQTNSCSSPGAPSRTRRPAASAHRTNASRRDAQALLRKAPCEPSSTLLKWLRARTAPRRRPRPPARIPRERAPGSARAPASDRRSGTKDSDTPALKAAVTASAHSLAQRRPRATTRRRAGRAGSGPGPRSGRRAPSAAARAAPASGGRPGRGCRVQRVVQHAGVAVDRGHGGGQRRAALTATSAGSRPA